MSIYLGNTRVGVHTVTKVQSPFSLQSKDVNPTLEQQVIYPDSLYDGLGSVTVNAVTSAIDSNIIPSNIAEGKTILGVTGTFAGKLPTQAKVATLSATESKLVVPDEGYTLSGVTIPPVTSDIDPNILPGNIKKGETILGIIGDYETPAKLLKVVPKTTAEIYEPEPGFLFNKVTVDRVTYDIDPNILPGNIKKGVNILGVDGTYSPKVGNKIIKPTNERQVIEASVDQLDGYDKITVEPITLTERILTPNAEGMVLAPDNINYYGFSKITINPEPNLLAENIKAGKSIFGVKGSYTPVLTHTTVKSLEVEQVIVPENASGFSQVTVVPVKYEEKVITPSIDEQIFTATQEGLDGYSKITVSTDSNLLPENIVKGKTIFGVEGTYFPPNSTSDATAISADIRLGKFAYLADGKKHEGIIPDYTGLYHIIGDPIIIANIILSHMSTGSGESHYVGTNLGFTYNFNRNSFDFVPLSTIWNGSYKSAVVAITGSKDYETDEGKYWFKTGERAIKDYFRKNVAISGSRTPLLRPGKQYNIKLSLEPESLEYVRRIYLTSYKLAGIGDTDYMEIPVKDLITPEGKNIIMPGDKTFYDVYLSLYDTNKTIVNHHIKGEIIITEL